MVVALAGRPSVSALSEVMESSRKIVQNNTGQAGIIPLPALLLGTWNNLLCKDAHKAQPHQSGKFHQGIWLAGGRGAAAVLLCEPSGQGTQLV